MKIINTAYATGPALDWLVWKCAGGIDAYPKTGSGPAFLKLWKGSTAKYVHPSTDWSQGGPILDRELIAISPYGYTDEAWRATTLKPGKHFTAYGDTALIAACRCFVASKLGDTVEVPEELL